MTNEITVHEDSLPTIEDFNPQDVLDSASVAAKALMDMVKKSKSSVKLGKNEYLQFEAWQTVGRFYHCMPKTGDAELIELDGVKGFKARAVVVNRDGLEIGSAEAFCMTDEKNWKGKPLFQLASMAQTRAAGKALRNVFAWVAVLAGYSPTPYEEMDGTGDKAAPKPKAKKKVDQPPVTPDMWDDLFTKAQEEKGLHRDAVIEQAKEMFKRDKVADATADEFMALEAWVDESPQPDLPY